MPVLTATGSWLFDFQPRMGCPHRAASRVLRLPMTTMHQARIILAVHGLEACVAQAPALRQTTAHPEPARVVTATCAWAGRFQRNRLIDLAAGGSDPEDVTMWNPCLTNDYQPILAAFMRPARPTFAFLGGARLGKKVLQTSPCCLLRLK